MSKKKKPVFVVTKKGAAYGYGEAGAMFVFEAARNPVPPKRPSIAFYIDRGFICPAGEFKAEPAAAQSGAIGSAPSKGALDSPEKS